MLGPLLLLTILAPNVGENLLVNGGFEAGWRANATAYPGTKAEGQLPDGWEDVSTWSGADTRYTRIDGPDGAALRVEVTRLAKPDSRLQLRSGDNLMIEAGGVYSVTGRIRGEGVTAVAIEVRQHEGDRIRFFETAPPVTPTWATFEHSFEAGQSGPSRFFLVLTAVGAVEVDDLAVTLVERRPAPVALPPVKPTEVRCVATRGPLLHRSDVIAMYQEGDVEVYRKYAVDVVAWGSQLNATPEVIAARRKQIEDAKAIGVRLHAVDCAMAQEGGRCIVSGGVRGAPTIKLFSELRKDNEAAIQAIGEAGIDLTKDTVLNVDGDWIGVPWLRKRWRIPMASVYSPMARKWFGQQMDAIAATGATALHFDEPAMGAYGLTHPTPGDFSDHAMAAFRDWLQERPEAVKQAGITDLETFDYRDMVRKAGGPKAAPLWREFVRFQLFTTVAEVERLRDRVRAQSDHPVPLSMNANASSWIKLPFLKVQDFMTTEVAHAAGSLQPPVDPLLVYKLGDAVGSPVASTAHGSDWYLIKKDEQPLLVTSWVAMAYALGHHLMIPARAWVMDPVAGSQTYRPTTDHFAGLARFIKQSGDLLEGYETVSTISVVLGADAIESDGPALDRLAGALADAQVPFSLAIEGNDLYEHHVGADDLAGTAAVLVACPAQLPVTTRTAIRELAGQRPYAEVYGTNLPSFLPHVIEVDGASDIWVLPRAKVDGVGPAVVHLLNRSYVPQTKQMAAMGTFTVRLDPVLWGGRPFTSAVIHQPVLPDKLDEATPVETVANVPLRMVDGQIELAVSDLKVWGIIELK